jgi:predicted transcriptional regulator
MVEHTLQLDAVFASLADATRRDILQRVIKKPRSIRELAEPYAMSFAGVAKHVRVLEQAALVRKTKTGTQQIISANPKAIAIATSHLMQYEKMWDTRFATLDQLLEI